VAYLSPLSYLVQTPKLAIISDRIPANLQPKIPSYGIRKLKKTPG
jgi:hypothetical protein